MALVFMKMYNFLGGVTKPEDSSITFFVTELLLLKNLFSLGVAISVLLS